MKLGWRGSYTTLEPWRFSIDLLYRIADCWDKVANGYEHLLRTHLDINVEDEGDAP